MSRDFAAVASKEARRENDEGESRGGQGTAPHDSKRVGQAPPEGGRQLARPQELELH